MESASGGNHKSVDDLFFVHYVYTVVEVYGGAAVGGDKHYFFAYAKLF